MTLDQKLTVFFEKKHAKTISKRIKKAKKGSAEAEEKKRRENAETTVKIRKLKAEREKFEKYGSSDYHKKRKVKAKKKK